MKFEPKISGTRVTDFHIDKWLFDSQFISLEECMKKVSRQETMNWILDTLRFSHGVYDEKTGVDYSHTWMAIIDHDSILKLSILEYYPEYEKEMIDYFGENWLNHYIRFNH